MSRDLCNAVQTERPMLYKLKDSMVSEKRRKKKRTASGKM
jgi:hypothetical protein